MNNPIIDNKWEAHGAVFEFAWDFSSLTIKKDGQVIVLSMHAVADLNILIRENIFVDGEKLGTARLWNAFTTSAHWPRRESDDL